MRICYSIVFFMFTTCTADIQLTLPLSRPTTGMSFTFTCTSNMSALTLNKGSTPYCTLGLVDGECKLDPSCPAQNTYSCNRNLQTYTQTITIAGSLVTDSLHGSKWYCNNPFGGGQSNEVELYVNVPITQVTIIANPKDNNPVEIVTDKEQQFQCQTDAGRPSSRIQWYISGTNLTSFATTQNDVCPPGCNGKVISSSILLYTGNRGDDNKSIYCTALNIGNQSVGSHNRTIVILYGPNQVNISPSTKTYTITETTGRVGPITCSADCKPNCTIIWSGPNLPAGTTSVLYLKNINRNQTGNYLCSCANIVGSLKSFTISVFVHYGPNQVVISPSTQMYTVIESIGSVGPITCSAECKPDCTMTWSGPNVPIATTSVLHMINVERNQAGNYQCTGTNTVGSLTSVNIIVSVHYGPNQVNISPPTQTYTVTETTGRVGPITCSTDCKPNCIMTWSGPSIPAGTKSVLNLINIDRNQSGNYQCSGANIVGNQTSVTMHLIVHYGPRQLNIFPSTPIYTVTETNASVGPVICSADCKPGCSVTWSGPNIPNGSKSVIHLKHIAKNQAGNYHCSATNSIGSLTLVKLSVIFQYKPFLDHTRPYSPELISATENQTLNITVTINANPTPTIEWIFKAEANMIPCNFSTIVSNTSRNGFSILSFILIDNVQNSNFGEYIISARNTVGVFSRRFVVIKGATLRQEMVACTKENTATLVAGIVTLVVGLLSLTAAVLFIVRNSFKKKAFQSSKSDEYTDVHRSNPTFTDPYTTLQSDIESRPSQTQCVHTYEECEGKAESQAFNSMEITEAEQKQPPEKGISIYEECGRKLEANAYENLIK